MRRFAASAAVVSLMLAACGSAGGSLTSSVCDGIPAEFGGCDEDRPTFHGTTCEAVGTEFGEQFSPRAIAIFDGPETVDGNHRTSQLGQLIVLHANLANKHLRDAGMVADCDVPEFFAAADASFGDDFRERVGQYAFFEQVITYEEWTEDLKRFLVVIDREETLPYDPSATPEASG